VPQLFILAAASRRNDPTRFPWTMPLVLPVRNEAKAHADYALRTNPKARVAALYQDDDLGNDYLAGQTEEFGAARITASATYQPTDPTVDSQIIALKASGDDTRNVVPGYFFALAGVAFSGCMMAGGIYGLRCRPRL